MSEGDETTINFHAVINPPPNDPPIKEEEPEEPDSCQYCPAKVVYDLTEEQDPLVRALPTILLGIGAAYLVGLLTANYFGTPLDISD